MALSRTLSASLWQITLLAIVFNLLIARSAFGAALPVDDDSAEGLTSAETTTVRDGGDDERTADGKYRDDVVPLESAEERVKFLTTLLMLEGLQDGKPSVKTAHPERLASDEEVLSDVFKLYQDTKAYHGKQYLKIPPKLMKKLRRKMKELMTE